MLVLRYDPELGEADVVLAADGSLANGDEDDDLATAILISLLTHAYDPAAPELERGGWWGDAYPPDGDETSLGSRLWRVLSRGTIGGDIVPAIEQAATDALAWLLELGVAVRVDVTASRTASDRMQLVVTTQRAGRDPSSLRLPLGA